LRNSPTGNLGRSSIDGNNTARCIVGDEGKATGADSERGDDGQEPPVTKTPAAGRGRKLFAKYQIWPTGWLIGTGELMNFSAFLCGCAENDISDVRIPRDQRVRGESRSDRSPDLNFSAAKFFAWIKALQRQFYRRKCYPTKSLLSMDRLPPCRI
jgi:hypothetical protein